jgi:mannose-6-phosphate isomerase-like protein (cupin superfamily)
MVTTRPIPIDDRMRADAEQGALAVFEVLVPPLTVGPPLHVHPSLDATYYVLEGRLVFRVDDVALTALPGASVFARRGSPQAYSNQAPAVARVLVVCTPGSAAVGDGAGHVSRIVGPPLAH